MNANKEEFAYTKEINNATVNVVVESGVITNQLVKKTLKMYVLLYT